MTGDPTEAPVRRVVGVSLNAAIDKVVSVPRLEPGRIHRPIVRSVVPGGKAANTVRAAHHLGLPGEVVAVLGGHAGAWYRDALDRAGIALREVREDTETRTCVSILDEEAGTLTELYEPGVTMHEGDWPAVEAALDDALGDDPEGTVVVLAGSLPPGAPADAYRRLATRTASARARAVVDIGGDPLAAALEAAPWLVKVNHEEAASILGLEGDTDPVRAARGLVARGARTAIVTLGIDGATLATGDWTWRLGPVPLDAHGPYSVGSGDAFTAGWLAGLAAGDDVVIALRRAGAAGAANARRPGQGELDPADVAAFLSRFRVEPVAR
ncbi:MAG TPA: PfkB family carbohydrate kinase [Candidatus Limnocylindrales bacterium]|nr:PfkB family carbohydrate kinase [Candidatus Limnocylindrales bacterium]